MTAKRKMIVTMNMIEFRGAIYRTEYAMICQPMTRIDTHCSMIFPAFICSGNSNRTTKIKCNYKY